MIAFCLVTATSAAAAAAAAATAAATAATAATTFSASTGAGEHGVVDDESYLTTQVLDVIYGRFL